MATRGNTGGHGPRETGRADVMASTQTRQCQRRSTLPEVAAAHFTQARPAAAGFVPARGQDIPNGLTQSDLSHNTACHNVYRT
eukprot:NODE_24655_length_616_cov_1.973415.p2 GENE.NODE_24655_length_616_cov_1.973415~~NODE_24655_length_616_cov_1.973415.p2  ORF type:complete len:83 (+),score=4.15 NODE_24655_length_616_cov_1.973415:300-548(+)